MSNPARVAWLIVAFVAALLLFSPHEFSMRLLAVILFLDFMLREPSPFKFLKDVPHETPNP